MSMKVKVANAGSSGYSQAARTASPVSSPVSSPRRSGATSPRGTCGISIKTASQTVGRGSSQKRSTRTSSPGAAKSEGERSWKLLGSTSNSNLSADRSQPIKPVHVELPQEVIKNLEQNADSPDELVIVLEQYRLDWEASGKYFEAEVAQRRLKELCDIAQSKRWEDLRAQQTAERRELEVAHADEVEQFNITWEKKAAEYEEHANRMLDEFRHRAEEEAEAYLDKLKTETEPRTPRFSAELLRIRNVQAHLGKKRSYVEAGEQKAMGDKMEAAETATWESLRNEKISKLEAKFLEKQSKEMKGLQKRIQTGRDEWLRSKELELKRITQRYNNVLKQLESQHKNVNARVSNFPITPKDIAQRMKSASQENQPKMTQLNQKQSSQPNSPIRPRAKSPSQSPSQSSIKPASALKETIPDLPLPAESVGG